MSSEDEASSNNALMDMDDSSAVNNVEDVVMKDARSEGESQSSSSSGESDLDELDEDDLDLLEQSNMRKETGSFRHLQRRVISDDDEAEAEDKEEEASSEDEEIGAKRKAALDRLFEDSDEEEEEEKVQKKKEGKGVEKGKGYVFEEEEESEGDSMSDFIEDDLEAVEEKAKTKQQKVKVTRKPMGASQRFGAGLPKDVLQDMLDIFGDGTEYLDAVDEDGGDNEDGEDASSAQQQQRKKKKPAGEASLEDVIRSTDMPERYQSLGMTSFADEAKGELQRETQWISNNLLPIVKERSPDASQEKLLPVVASLLTLIRDQGLEIPFIATHRKEYFQHILGLNDLWRVLDWDEEWRAASRHRKAFVQLAERKYGPSVLGIVSQILADDVEAGMGEAFEVLGEYVRRVLSFGQQQQPAERKHHQQQQMSEEERVKVIEYVRSFCWDPKDFPLAWAMRDGSRQPPEPATENVDQEGVNLSAAISFAAAELAFHPQTSRMFRGALQASGTISVSPTERGLREITMTHELAPWKHVEGKPIASITDDLYLRLARGEKEGLLKLSIGFGGKEADLIADWLACYRGGSSAWADLRERVFQEALQSHVLPRMRKHLHAVLERDGQAFVGQCCQYAMQSKLMQAPFAKGDVMAISWGDGKAEEATMAVLLDSEGRVLDQGKFAHLQAARRVASEWERLGKFIQERRPALLVVGGTSTATEELFTGLKGLLRDLDVGTKIIYGDDDAARVYQRSQRAALEFPEYGQGLRYCVSLGRRWLCPLYELASLTPAEAATRLSLHPSQALVPQERLSKWIIRAFVNVVNLVGVEIGRAVASPWVRSALKYVAGLGPLKAEALCQALSKASIKLDRIVDLTEHSILPPLVYANCASFLKLSQSAEPLDQTRIHPENYVLARKIACDALEVSLEEAEDQEATARSSVLQVMKRPERLNDLLLDEYARELERRLHIPKHLTLLDIKAELQAPYADLRNVVEEASAEVVFEALTGETERTLFLGQHVHARVTRLGDRSAYCKLESGLSGHLSVRHMPVLSSSGKSPSHPKQALRPHQTIEAAVIGIDLRRFEVELSMLPSDLREPRKPLAGDFDPYYNHDAAKEAARTARRGFSTPATAASPSHPRSGVSSQPMSTERKLQQQHQQPVRRLISHPSFKEIGRAEAEAILESSMLGEVIIRPSGSRGSNHLALTWKIDSVPASASPATGSSSSALFQHIDIEERDRPTDYSLGRRLLIKSPDGSTLVYEDLDEIIARHVEPISAYLTDARRCPKYLPVSTLDPPASRSFIEAHLERERSKAPARIAYCLSMSRDRPGSILLSYQPASRPHHELVDVMPAGFKFRGKAFDSLEALINWFKQNYARKQ